MHYGDKQQLEKSKLTIIVYNMGNLNGGFDCQITSIVECNYFHPWDLKRLLEHPNNLKPFLEDKPMENWFRIQLKNSSVNDYEVTSIENVSESLGEFDNLH